MNFLAVKVGLKTIVTKAGFFLKRNAPTICTTLGVAGFVGTAVTTGTAAVKAKEIMDDRDKKIQGLEEAGAEQKSIKAVKKEASAALAKTFAPPVTLGIASGALVFGGQHMMGRRAAAALASAYEWQKKLHTYRGNVVQQLGSEVDKRLSEGIPLDKADISDKLKEQVQEEKKNEEEGVKVLKRPWDEINRDKLWWFGETTCSSRLVGGIWTGEPQHDLASLRRIKRRLYDRVCGRGYALMNDAIVDEFGAPHGTGYGATHGWFVDPRTGEIPIPKIYVVGLNGKYIEVDELGDALPGREVQLAFNCSDTPVDTKIDEIAAKQYHKWYRIERIGDRRRYVPNI